MHIILDFECGFLVFEGCFQDSIGFKGSLCGLSVTLEVALRRSLSYSLTGKAHLMTSLELSKKIRQAVLKMIARAGSSHIGSCLSCADLVAVAYTCALDINPNHPEAADRDRFVMSKGHAGASVYAALAELRFFDCQLLDSYYDNGSLLSGHVSNKGVPGVEVSTGSLGLGLGIACGMAYYPLALGTPKPFNVISLLSDGELNEGSTWEAIMFASHYGLFNLTAVIDANGLQSLDTTENTISMNPLADKFIAFGWDVYEVDGHDHKRLRSAYLEKAKRPKAIIAHTLKGKGISFMEGKVDWHYRFPNADELAKALEEINSEE